MVPSASDEPKQLLAPPAVALLAVARVSDGAVLARLEDKASSAEELQAYEAALSGLLEQAADLPASPGWKASQGLGDEGCVYVLADAQALVVVAAAVRRQYPERLAQAMLQELAKEVHAAESAEKISEAKAGKFTGSLKGPLRSLMRKYSEPAKMDRVPEVHRKATAFKHSEPAKVNNESEVHENVDLVKGLMQDNIKRILETHATIESLESKSTSLSTSANQFLKRSTDLKRQVEARNLRVKLLTVSVAGALALYVSLPFLGW